MISHEEAYDIVMETAKPLGVEQVQITESVNRILAEDVASDMDMPPFNKSAMDGYACRKEDLADPLTVIESIQAGLAPTRSIGPGECAKIMTGAVVPEGANCVIMVEFTETAGDDRIRFTGKSARRNICFRGEDIRQGDTIARQGDRISSRLIALLASVGCVSPRVAVRPKIGVIATGTEIVEPDTAPDASQIRNSNSYQLQAQVSAAGAIPIYMGIAKDTEESTDRLVKKALTETDIVLLSGGVSMGDFDIVPGILRNNGFNLLFEQLAVKPGKPTVFGLNGATYCFGLPGNPVSTFIIFEILVKPFIYKLMGHDYRVPTLRMPLRETISRRKTDRASWMPVRFSDHAAVIPMEYHGSAHVNALVKADGLVCIPRGVETLEKGANVDVRPIWPEN